MNILTRYFLLLFLLTLTQAVFSQRQVLGRISDTDTKKPINAAKIVIEGTDSSTVTNYLGYFQLTVDSTSTLLISGEGYTPVQLKAPEADKFQLFLTRAVSPAYQEEIKQFYQFVMKNLRYPVEALRSNTNQLVYASFEIDSLGKMQHISIHADNRGKFGKEIMRVLQKAPNYAGLAKTTERFILPVRFKIENAKPIKEDAGINLPDGRILSEVTVTASQYVQFR